MDRAQTALTVGLLGVVLIAGTYIAGMWVMVKLAFAFPQPERGRWALRAASAVVIARYAGFASAATAPVIAAGLFPTTSTAAAVTIPLVAAAAATLELGRQRRQDLVESQVAEAPGLRNTFAIVGAATGVLVVIESSRLAGWSGAWRLTAGTGLAVAAAALLLLRAETPHPRRRWPAVVVTFVVGPALFFAAGTDAAGPHISEWSQSLLTELGVGLCLLGVIELGAEHLMARADEGDQALRIFTRQSLWRIVEQRQTLLRSERDALGEAINPKVVLVPLVLNEVVQQLLGQVTRGRTQLERDVADRRRKRQRQHGDAVITHATPLVDPMADRYGMQTTGRGEYYDFVLGLAHGPEVEPDDVEAELRAYLRLKGFSVTPTPPAHTSDRASQEAPDPAADQSASSGDVLIPLLAIWAAGAVLFAASAAVVTLLT